MNSLLRYSGIRLLEHLGPNGAGHAITTYGLDQSGTKLYRFNSLGFRGEEPSLDATARIFVCGCSFTFGTGLDAAETWPLKLKDRLATSWGVETSAVDLLNFSQGGASNCYITRTLISQMTQVRPDFVIALFTHKARYELYDSDRAVHVLPTMVELYKGSEWIDRVEHSWLGMSDADLAMLYLKNVLLLQSYCDARRIPFLFGSIENLINERFFEEIHTPLTSPLLSAINFDRFVPLTQSMWVDKAADNAHPGPMSQDHMMEAFWAALPQETRTGPPRIL